MQPDLIHVVIIELDHILMHDCSASVSLHYSSYLYIIHKMHFPHSLCMLDTSLTT